ncbi:MAG: hypothetical protein V3R80_09925 [Candidatus Tectomicrobia bacterium]
MAHDDEHIEELPARRLSEEEQYYFEHAYKEPVESISRIEEVAKFLVGATATTSGLFLAAVKISHGKEAIPGWEWLLPFLCWGGSICALVGVLFPQPYATGANEPASWKAAFRRARRVKYGVLTLGTLLFIAGILTAVYALAHGT